jgi:hypothetical protein
LNNFKNQNVKKKSGSDPKQVIATSKVIFLAQTTMSRILWKKTAKERVVLAKSTTRTPV